jgi:acetyl esterase
MLSSRFSLGALFSCVAFCAFLPAAEEPAQQKGKKQSEAEESLKEATARVYKKVGETELKLYVFNPPGLKAADKRPAIVFFFGGGWTNGSPTQFAEHCRYLASRGMVAMTAEYRVKSRNESTVEQSTADAKSAIRFVRSHAMELGIDPKRIAAGGGSAGGHLAACTGTLDGADEPGEDTKVSAVPNAMVLFNPALVLPSRKELQAKGDARNLSSRFAGDPQALSPADHVRSGQPPAIVFHGKDDTTVAIDTAEKFRDNALKAGNRCELVAYEGETHGFFNWNRKGKAKFADTLEKTDEFLASLGWLEGKPAVREFFKGAIE